MMCHFNRDFQRFSSLASQFETRNDVEDVQVTFFGTPAIGSLLLPQGSRGAGAG